MTMHDRRAIGIGVLCCLAFALPAMASPVVVQEGKGLPTIYVGQSAAEAVAVLGSPADQLFGMFQIHRLADGTELNLRLQDGKIINISFRGSPESPYVAARGGRFGMSPKEIVNLYGEPDLEVAGKLFYLSQGVSFFFEEDACYEFNVFPRE